MNYKLCKKLKDNGFPQEYYNQWGGKQCVCFDNGDGTEIHGIDWEDSDREKGIVVPTLSELVEACGGKFGALLVGPGLTLWTAKGSGVEVHCPTPEEAVAELWLRLNTNV